MRPWYDATHTDALGRVWRCANACPPIPWRGADWHATRDGYEPGDDIVEAETLDKLRAAIDEFVAEQVAEVGQ